jgi:hypothetical protein
MAIRESGRCLASAVMTSAKVWKSCSVREGKWKILIAVLGVILAAGIYASTVYSKRHRLGADRPRRLGPDQPGRHRVSRGTTSTSPTRRGNRRNPGEEGQRPWYCCPHRTSTGGRPRPRRSPRGRFSRVPRPLGGGRQSHPAGRHRPPADLTGRRWISSAPRSSSKTS